MSTSNIENFILHIDDHLIAVNKPAGLRVIPDGYDASIPNLRDMLNARFNRVWILHRLDKDTSGIILFARDADTHRALNLQFQNRTIRKQYHLIVIGIPDWDNTTTSLPLRVNGDRKHRTIVDLQNGKHAETTFSVDTRFSQHCLLTAQPHSGYTHQIRAHISAVGFPILGDSLYWKALAHLPSSSPQKPPSHTQSFINRVALHAFAITYFDVYTKSQRSFSAKYPVDFSSCLNKLNHLKNFHHINC